LGGGALLFCLKFSNHILFSFYTHNSIHAENPTSTKVNVTFYDMFRMSEQAEKKKGKKKSSGKELVAEVNKVETLEGKQCNCIFWSPAGRTIILAALGDAASGTLEFYDVDNKSLVIKEHYRANQVLWDPSGRTLATTVSQPIGGGHFKFAMDNGFIIWSFQGKQISQQSFETFYQFSFVSKRQEERERVVLHSGLLWRVLRRLGQI